MSQVNAIVTSNSRVQLKLAKLHSLMDSTIQSMLVASPPVVCKRGCSYCCNFKVPVSRQEAERLSHATGRKLTVPTVWTQFDDPRPCPFLADGECSAYADRPSACRAYHVFKAQPGTATTDCTQLGSAAEYGVAQLLLTAIPEEFQFAWFALERQAKEPPQLADIRDWFPSL